MGCCRRWTVTFFWILTTGQGGVRFTNYKPDDTPLHCIRLTFYEPDVWLSGYQNSKKCEPYGFIRVPTKNLKNPPKSKILPPCRSLSSINTAQWSKSLPYSSITLKTFKNGTLEDVFQKNGRLLHCSRLTWVDGWSRTILCFLINKGIFGISMRLLLELNFCMEVQEEGMGVEEEFVIFLVLNH